MRWLFIRCINIREYGISRYVNLSATYLSCVFLVGIIAILLLEISSVKWVCLNMLTVITIDCGCALATHSGGSWTFHWLLM
jgi:hypothetical protein